MLIHNGCGGEIRAVLYVRWLSELGMENGEITPIGEDSYEDEKGDRCGGSLCIKCGKEWPHAPALKEVITDVEVIQN